MNDRFEYLAIALTILSRAFTRETTAMRAALAVTTIAICALAVGGCAKSTAPAPPPQLPQPATAQPAQDPGVMPGVRTNERHNIPKQLGQQAGLSTDNGSDITFSVDRITVDPPCDMPLGKQPGQHLIRVDMRVATPKSNPVLQGLPVLFSPNSWSTLGADGVTTPAVSGFCADGTTKSLPQTYGANQKYRGTVDLLVPERHGTLALTQPMSDAGGWEWEY